MWKVQAVRKDSAKEFGWEPPRKRAAATFGLPKGACKPHCPLYLKKYTGGEKNETHKINGAIITNCFYSDTSSKIF